MRLKGTIGFLVGWLCFASVGLAAIDFEAITVGHIDLEKLKVSKSSFLAFADAQVRQRSEGLGTYGIVDFNACDYPVAGKPLSKLENLEGKALRLLSTPSCQELVIQKVLVQNYQFGPEVPSAYKARRCIYTLIKAFRPMMEYYTLKYEEAKSGNCSFCEDQQRRRLEKIAKVTQKTTQFCGENQPKVQQFLNDLSGQLDQSFIRKNSPNP